MTLAMVNVLPEPVTPKRVVWRECSSRIDLTNPFIASGWSPVGEYDEVSLKSMLCCVYYVKVLNILSLCKINVI